MLILAFITISFSNILQESLYIGMLLLLLAASLGLPLPEDIPLLLGGCLSRLGYGDVFYVILVGLFGVLAGDITLFFIGRRFGLKVLQMKPFRSLLTREHIAQMKFQFRKRGNVIIFFGRFFAGIRSIMCVTAGLSRVPIWKFIMIDVAGAMVTVPLLVGLGWWFSDNISKVMRGVAAAEHVIAIGIAAILVIWVISIHINKKSRVKKITERAREDLTAKDEDPGETL